MPRPAGPGTGVYDVDTRTRAVGGPANTSAAYPAEDVRRREEAVSSPPRAEVRESIVRPEPENVPTVPTKIQPRPTSPEDPDAFGDPWDDAAVDSGFEDVDVFDEELPEGYSDEEENAASVGQPAGSGDQLGPRDAAAAGGRAMDIVVPQTKNNAVAEGQGSTPSVAVPKSEASIKNTNAIAQDTEQTSQPSAPIDSQAGGTAPIPAVKDDGEDTGAMSDDSQGSKRPHLTIKTNLNGSVEEKGPVAQSGRAGVDV
ncbi:hypothetical protein BD626DRAFT_562807 [Schizophyllum amplum]|uniref:Uncharacterized protein n=1 Tax=Schizophyllum amplum TaxID=97359 RepID=A0A550CW21_9AGAR|nr:hypothetical protein BD626DRAFT_562807 [Auriculariopsis ampla]